ncbi:hypothetical protein VZT92_012596 [Zoarces viviparus]|uniref:Uncharacterized protein n=1 Tax=Zoarces viviparus TaxID=48416 RepID=A0AAW1F1E6_ZOAVI
MAISLSAVFLYKKKQWAGCFGMYYSNAADTLLTVSRNAVTESEVGWTELWTRPLQEKLCWQKSLPGVVEEIHPHQLFW